MSWDIQIGPVDDPITVYDGASVRAAVAAVLVAVNGETAKGAQEKALRAWRTVGDGSRDVWRTTLADDSEQVLTVQDSSPEPQYDKQRDGLDGFGGNRCGRYLNHPGEC